MSNSAKIEMDTAAIKKVTTRKLVEFCAKDIRPFEIVKGEGFKIIAQHFWTMGSIYGDRDVTSVLPHPTTISRNVSAIKTEKLEKLVPVLEKSIGNGECSASTDMWTEDHKKNHFLTMTAHYFDENFKLKRSVLFTPLFKAKKKSGVNIRKELKKRFRKMGLNPKLLLKIQFVTDQGGNVVNALNKPYKRDNCRNHLLNTILKNAFESDNSPLIILKTLTICKNIVRHLKQSGKSNQLSKSVVQDCNTRWNYKLDMLNSVIERYTEIIPLLPDEQRDKWAINMELAEELKRFLTPFKEATKSMEGDTYTTANKVALWWADLTEHLNESEFDLLPMKKIVRITKKIFLEKYTVDMTNKIACFLDPRYRSLKMFTDAERNEVFDEVKRLIEVEKTCPKEAYIPPPNHNIFLLFEGRLDENNLDEFQLYMNTADYSLYIEDDNTKKHLTELFWRDNKERLPNLYSLARKRLHVPASSCSSERVFSDAKRTCEPRRTNIEPKILDDLLFIRDHFANI